MINQNFVKNKIKKGIPVIGTWNTLASPLVTEVLAASGFDFIVIDFEHGPCQLDQIHSYVSKCEPYQCSPIIRIPKNEDWMVLQALDQGSHGVMIPHIENKQELQKFISAAYYAPKGGRGYSPYSKAGGFTNETSGMYLKRSHHFPLTALIIESSEGLNNLDEILEVKDFDVVYFGAYDLSHALGFPGKIDHPSLIRRIKEATKKVTSCGKCAGGFVAQSQADIKRFLDMGLTFITYNIDSNIIIQHASRIVKQFKNSL